MKLPITTTLCAAFLVFAVQMSALAQDNQAISTKLTLRRAQESGI